LAPIAPFLLVVHFDFRNLKRLMQVKETIKDLLERLPEDCSLEDVLYHIYVLQNIEQGRADVQAGRTISHEQVAEQLRRKWTLGAGK